MTVIAGFEVIALAASLAVVFCAFAGRGGRVGGDVRLLIVPLALVAGFAHLSNSLEWSGVTASLDQTEDYLEILLPALWWFFLYAFMQEDARRRLRQSEERNRILLARMPHRIFFKDTDSVFVSVNDLFARGLGARPEDVVGRTDFDFYPRELAQKYVADDRAVMQSGRARVIVEKNVIDGEERIVEVTKVPVTDDDGRLVGLLGVFTDISERLRTERAIKEAEREKAAILNSMVELVAYHAPDLKVLWANQAAADSLGMSTGELEGRYCYELWHQRSEPCPGCPVLEALRTGTVQGGEVTTPDGCVWFVRGCPVCGPDGDIVGVVETTLDITERKRAAENLARLAAIVEASDDAMMACAPDGTLLSWNRGAEDIYGHERGEVLGRPITMLALAEGRDALANIIHEAAGGRSLRAYEMRHRTRAGRPIDVALTISPVRGPDGLVSALSIVARDITREVELRELLRALSLVDELTGLNNRRGFFHLAGQQLKFARRTGNRLVMLFLDVDNMKWINDTLGHKYGDLALVEAATVLRQTFRESDVLGRIGGDEMAVLAVGDEESARHTLLHRLYQNVAARNAERGRKFELALSVGVVGYEPESQVTLDELIARADARMYEHKRSKRRQ